MEVGKDLLKSDAHFCGTQEGWGLIWCGPWHFCLLMGNKENGLWLEILHISEKNWKEYLMSIPAP